MQISRGLLSGTALVLSTIACSGGESTGAGGAGGESSNASSSSSSSSASSSSSSSSSGSSSSSSSGGGGSQGFSMLSLNLHCLKLDGTVYATNAERFAAIASFAASRDVAVLAVQEACERPGEKAIEMLRLALEKATGQAFSSTWAFAHIAWEGTPDEANEGVGLLVRGALSSPNELPHAVQGALRRVAVSATLPQELLGLRVTSVHFEVFEEAARTMQARETAVAALADTDPIFGSIVAGDFNDVEGSRTHSAFPAMGYRVADKGLDPTGIDHVMVHRAAKLQPESVEKVFLGAEAVSDHPGIWVRFSIANGDEVSATRVTANASPGAGHYLSIRGNTAPLSWTLGFPMRQKSASEAAFVTTEIMSDYELKILLDDSTWQTGMNVLGKAGMATSVTPSF